MKSQSLSAALVISSSIISLAVAQTYSQCNPLTGGSCPPDTALGKSVDISLSAESDSFTSQGNPTYGSDGVSLTVAKDGDSPQLTSKWYIMFGHVEFVVKAAPGTGIVSSAVLQSDDLDEIDWEWLGGDDNQVQSNYFGQGKTLSYNRGAFHSAPGNHDGFKTYTIDWTADQIVWSIDGQSVRALSSSTASQYPYPQTPMMVKVGAWCGGCPSNAPGTIQWAGGATNIPSGGSTMQVKSISVTDYSTGSQYKYSGTDGTWQSITAVGGSVNPKGGKGSPAGSSAPEVSATSNTGPMPFQGTHSDKSTNVAQPNAGGWTPTTLATSGTPTVTTYPGLPDGWSVTSSGKVLPPSAAPVTSPPTTSSSPSALSPQPSQAGGSDSVTLFNGQGFPVVVPAGTGETPEKGRYDDKGFLITTGLDSRALPASEASTFTTSTTPTTSGSSVQAEAASASFSTPSISKSTSKPTSAASRAKLCGKALGGALSMIAGVLLL